MARAALGEVNRETRRELEKLVAENKSGLYEAAGRRVEEPQVFKDALDRVSTRFAKERSHLVLASFLAGLAGDEPGLSRLARGPYGDDGSFIGVGFPAYAALGDLQGSGLLQNAAAIDEACRVVYDRAQQDNIRYLELRCSPFNYIRGGLDFDRVVDVIRAAFQRETARAEEKGGPACRVELIFIATRHAGDEEIRRHVESGVNLCRAGMGGPGVRVVGYDLAGNEAAGRPEQLRDLFRPVFEHCLRLTIHAGETAEVASIWEAVYHLNADRIGHGLNLADNRRLLDRFRDRGIGVELCPSSNYQILGFRDFRVKESASLPIYPLRDYLDQGLEICINTDNPGISRTDLSREYLKAAGMTPGGLSRWEVLGLVKMGFRKAFLPRPELSDMIKEMDAEIYDLMSLAV